MATAATTPAAVSVVLTTSEEEARALYGYLNYCGGDPGAHRLKNPLLYSIDNALGALLGRLSAR